MPSIDVSLILNVHEEKIFLQSTLNFLEAAAAFARQSDLFNLRFFRFSEAISSPTPYQGPQYVLSLTVYTIIFDVSLLRVHRIEATETKHVATAPWRMFDDLIVVSEDIRRRVLHQAPEIAFTTRRQVISNGVDVDRFDAVETVEEQRIGWGGLMTLRKNPTLASEILSRLRTIDPAYHLYPCSINGDPFAMDTFSYHVAMLGLERAVVWDGMILQHAMVDWHRRNAALLHTNPHESFGYIAAHAPLCGCRAASLDHAEAREGWPTDVFHDTLAGAVALLLSPRRAAPRDLLVDRHGIDRLIATVADVVSRRAAAAAAV